MKVVERRGTSCSGSIDSPRSQMGLKSNGPRLFHKPRESRSVRHRGTQRLGNPFRQEALQLVLALFQAVFRPIE